MHVLILICIFLTRCYAFSISVRLGEYDTEKDPDCVELFGGRKDCSPPPVNIPIEELIPHEQYNPNDRNQYHDIALLRLKLPVKYSGMSKITSCGVGQRSGTILCLF